MDGYQQFAADGGPAREEEDYYHGMVVQVDMDRRGVESVVPSTWDERGSDE